jgi:hypothetical protein
MGPVHITMDASDIMSNRQDRGDSDFITLLGTVCNLKLVSCLFPGFFHLLLLDHG